MSRMAELHALLTEPPDGPAIKRARLAAGMTQQQLATAAGITQRTLSRIEQGQVLKPHRPTLITLAMVLGL